MDASTNRLSAGVAAILVAVAMGLPAKEAYAAPPASTSALSSPKTSSQWLVNVGSVSGSPQGEQKLLQSVLQAVAHRAGGQWRIKQALLQPGTYVLEAPALLKAPLLDDTAIAQLIQGVPGVVFAHPNYVLRHARQGITPTDTEFAQRQFEYLGTGTYAALNMPMSWGFARGSADQVIAVLDSGVLYNHPELRGRLLPGYDFVTLVSPKTGMAPFGSESI